MYFIGRAKPSVWLFCFFSCFADLLIFLNSQKIGELKRKISTIPNLSRFKIQSKIRRHKYCLKEVLEINLVGVNC